MAERRSLAEALKSLPASSDPQKEQDFVYGSRKPAPPPTTTPEELHRVALSTRIRGDFVKALKRASLERQLHCVKPSAINEVLEQALEPWLRSNGYLP